MCVLFIKWKPVISAEIDLIWCCVINFLTRSITCMYQYILSCMLVNNEARHQYDVRWHINIPFIIIQTNTFSEMSVFVFSYNVHFPHRLVWPIYIQRISIPHSIEHLSISLLQLLNFITTIKGKAILLLKIWYGTKYNSKIIYFIYFHLFVCNHEHPTNCKGH